MQISVTKKVDCQNFQEPFRQSLDDSPLNTFVGYEFYRKSKNKSNDVEVDLVYFS